MIRLENVHARSRLDGYAYAHQHAPRSEVEPTPMSQSLLCGDRLFVIDGKRYPWPASPAGLLFGALDRSKITFKKKAMTRCIRCSDAQESCLRPTVTRFYGEKLVALQKGELYLCSHGSGATAGSLS
jgi:hypothetical protein